ncbi:hypothetical protein [Nonomuraea pusilla]|uniref:Uncharacterized protein n=1 Tax=Nonomuraea pusilla TaxID=46177 RepID=A0A1H7IMP1_9ACTN|nr:hypothetical protein [Nonomuraea pusilla]SEK62015.1 hypothetical protein SAMN05660976_00811 [Nonomuraea pusilla]
MATDVRNPWWRGPFFPGDRRRRAEAALRPAEETGQEADGAAQESRAGHHATTEALVKDMAAALEQVVHEQTGRVLAAVEGLRQPSPPVEDAHLGRLYRLYLCSGRRGGVQAFIEWMLESEEHRQYASPAVEAVLQGEEVRQRRPRPPQPLSPEVKATYEALAAPDRPARGGTDLVA